MQKSKKVTLSVIFIAAIISCNDGKDEWISGDVNRRDTIINSNTYRHYNGSWYPVYHNMINPGRYNGASSSEISSPSFHSSPRVTSGGFGSSSHFSATS